MRRRRFESSSAASNRVEDVNGVVRMRYTANRSASAVSDFSVPDMSIIFVMRLPRGCAVTSTPVFSKSSGSTSVELGGTARNSTANIR